MRTIRTTAIVACVIILCVAIVYLAFPALVEHLEEDVTFAMHPSAQLAFSYGERHFSATNPKDYDIGRADYFFEKAATLDPTLPYLYHELARISFLQGNLTGALVLIDLQISLHGDAAPSSYYMRGLIEGFMGDYPDSERDYAHYLTFDPIDWAAVNDYSWVLLKDNKPAQADAAIEKVLQYFPNNPWLYNSDAIALSEMGETTQAKQQVAIAAQAVENLTPAQWSLAYPGNDPRIAPEGLDAFKAAVLQNMHTIDAGNVANAIQ